MALLGAAACSVDVKGSSSTGTTSAGAGGAGASTTGSGGSTMATGGNGGDPGSTGGGGSGMSTGGSGGGGAPAVNCSQFGEQQFPAFDKSCAASTDCVLKVHVANCCGTHVVIGISAAASAAFDQAEAKCESQLPPCGCNTGPTLTEDGKQTDYDGTMSAVACQDGSCMSYTP